MFKNVIKTAATAAIVGIMAISVPTCVSAAEQSAAQSADAKINENVTVTLNTSSFKVVKANNPWLDAHVYLTLKDSSTVDEVIVYATTSTGTGGLPETHLKRGYTVDFNVGMWSGEWTVSAKAVGTGGSATFHLED
jgi:hypothetical protein